MAEYSVNYERGVQALIQLEQLELSREALRIKHEAQLQSFIDAQEAEKKSVENDIIAQINIIKNNELYNTDTTERRGFISDEKKAEIEALLLELQTI